MWYFMCVDIEIESTIIEHHRFRPDTLLQPLYSLIYVERYEEMLCYALSATHAQKGKIKKRKCTQLTHKNREKSSMKKVLRRSKTICKDRENDMAW